MNFSKHLNSFPNLSTTVSTTISTSSPPSPPPSQDYLLGLRALLTIQTFLYTFFQLFLPSAVVSSDTTTGPQYAFILRKTLSPIFFNEPLLFTLSIILSARSLALSFLATPTPATIASSLFRRPIRLFLPVLIIYALNTAAFNSTSTAYISDFLALTNNTSTAAPIRYRSPLVAFNALFDLFWINKRFASQLATQAFPSGTIWLVSVLFQQSYTVYMTMLIIPYTRVSWRVKALLVFIVTAFWVQSWAWYSITGLLLADVVANMRFRERSRAGWHLGGRTLPTWPAYVLLMVVGVLLQYLWAAWRPEWRDQELKGHTGLYTGGSLNERRDEKEPGGRVDTWCIVLGVMLIVETFEGARKVLGWKGFAAVGRRSFSAFLVQPLLMYTAGVKLYLHMHARGASHELATLVCFITCVPLVALSCEIFYRFVDVPSAALAKKAWIWFRE